MVIRIFLLIGLFSCATQMNGQDVIITILGDSIHCKVDRSDERFTYYRTTRTSRGETELISNREIRTINFQAYPQKTNRRLKPDSERFIKDFQVYVDGGYSRLLSTDEVPEFLQDYDKRLRNGFNIGGGANVFFNKVIGIGALYNHSVFSNSFYITGVGEFGDHIQMSYLAVNLAFRFNPSTEKHFRVQMDLGMGRATYQNDAILIHEVKLYGETLGVHTGVSFQLDLGNRFHIPLSARIKGFFVDDIEVSPGDNFPAANIDELRNDISKAEPFSMFRYELVAGLLFTF